MSNENNSDNFGENKVILSQTMDKDTNEASSATSYEKSTKKSTFMLPIELHKCLKTTAADQGKTMLEIVEEALRDHLKFKD